MIHLAIVILLVGAVADEESARLTLLDGTTVGGRISKWNGEIIEVTGPDGSRTVAPSELLDVRFSHDDAPAETTPMSLELVDGSRFAITAFTTKAGTATIETPHSEEPIEIAT